MAEYIEREAVKKLFDSECFSECSSCQWDDYGDCTLINQVPSADVQPVPDGGIGEMSDGYHTFNGLYYQRMMLFASLVKAYKDKAWKTRYHEDGEPCFGGGWFLVTIDTPAGAYGYHYEDKYWDMFDCEELPKAKHWDGYTEEDITRLQSLPDVQPVKWIPVTEQLPDYDLVVLVTDGEDVGTGYRYTLGETGFTGWAVPFADIEEDNVSHWIPLPEPPKDGET